MKDKEKTACILEALKQHFTTWGRGRTNIIFPELRLGSGYCGVAQRRMDFFVISSNAGNETIGFEIKASRQDFKKDVTDELKQRGARLYCNRFYYVAPKGMLKSEEIPIWAGLWELDLDNDVAVKDARFSETVPAPLFPKAVPSWGLICSMIRHVNKDTSADYVEVTKLRDDLYKQKLENENLKRLLSDIAKQWTDCSDFSINIRLDKFKKF